MSASPPTAPSVTASLRAVRRLALVKQHLAGPKPARATGADIVALVRDLAFVQWDPASGVAPSHVLALRARVGDVAAADLERLMWDDRRLFLHWLPIASLVLTEDYPLFSGLMRRYPGSLTSSWGSQRDEARAFLAQHGALRERVLAVLASGPRRVDQFEGHERGARSADGWSSGSEVAKVLHHLHMRGEVMVVARQVNRNVWGLTEPFLPSWVERHALPQDEVERAAAQRAIRALGTATPSEIHLYFVRGRYQDLGGALAALARERAIYRVHVTGFSPRDQRYVHADDLDLLDSLEQGDWRPRMSLLPPFDNLTSDRRRTTRLFDFAYVHEQFLPANKRKHGAFALPILWGDALIGRIDPVFDRDRDRLTVRAVHAEPDAPSDGEVARRLADEIRSLGAFLGAGDIAYGSDVPATWRGHLR